MTTALMILRLVACLAVGAAAGAGFFVLLRLNARLYATGRGWPWGVALHLARWAGLVAVLILLARAGGLRVVAAALGVFLVRPLVLRGAHAAGPDRAPAGKVEP
jgi:F1F0 ATPase subunit 2